MSVSSIPGSQDESQEWIELPLLELIEPLESGSRPKGGVRGIDSGIPSVGGEHLTAGGGFNFAKVKFVPKSFYASMRRGHIRRGDILIVKDGATTGKVALVRDDFPFKEAVVNEHVFIIRPKSDHDSRYIFWYLHSKEGQERVLEHFQGAAQGGINQQFAPGTLVPIPPTRDDEVTIADQIEGLVEGLQSPRDRLATIPALLKKFRQSILAAAYDGSVLEGTEGLMLAPKVLRDVVDRIEAGKSFRAEGFPPRDGEPGVIKVSAMTWGEFDPRESKKLLPGTKPNPRTEIKPGDLLFSRANTEELVGATVLVKSTPPNIYLSDKSLRLVTSPGVSRAWLNIVLSAPQVREYFADSATGTSNSMRNISQAKLLITPLLVPDPEVQEQIANRVESLFALVDSIESRLAEATAQVERTTQAILAKAFRGELEVDVTELPEPKRVTTSIDTPLAHEEPTEQKLIQSKMKTSLKEIVLTSDQSRFDPEQLRTLFSGDYDAFRDELFALLSEPRPILRQLFDESTQRILLVKE